MEHPLNKRVATLSIKVESRLYEDFKATLKTRDTTITDSIEAHMRQVVKMEDWVIEFEKMKSAMDFLYPNWKGE